MTQLLSRFYDPVEGLYGLTERISERLPCRACAGIYPPFFRIPFCLMGQLPRISVMQNRMPRRKEIEAAARAANIHDDIMHMPERV